MGGSIGMSAGGSVAARSVEEVVTIVVLFGVVVTTVVVTVTVVVVAVFVGAVSFVVVVAFVGAVGAVGDGAGRRQESTRAAEGIWSIRATRCTERDVLSAPYDWIWDGYNDDVDD